MTATADRTQEEIVKDYIAEANGARLEYERAGGLYAGLVFMEAKLEAERPVKKLEGIQRIMLTPNGLTGKQHSASSAEAIVETDAEYAEHLALQRVTVRDKNHTHVRMESARLRAYTALAAVKAIAGFFV